MRDSPVLHAYVLCGGAGTRLWPLSRQRSPKQLLELGDSKPLLLATLDRLRRTGLCAEICLVTGEHLYRTLRHQAGAGGLAVDAVLIEPAPRNTAPAVAAAAFRSAGSGGDPVIAVFPADHAIDGNESFADAIAKATLVAQEGKIGVIGVAPKRGDTSFGYIQQGSPFGSVADAHLVRRFTEKPTAADAASFATSAGYLWNTGIFVAKASVLIGEIHRHVEPIAKAVQCAYEDAKTDGEITRLSPTFVEAPAISLDYAVMEHTSLAAVIPGRFDWSDLGSWQSVWRTRKEGESDNSVEGDVRLKRVTSSLVWNRSDQLVAAMGLDEMALIVTRDAILCAPLDEMGELGELVGDLVDGDMREAIEPPVLEKPWGRSEVLAVAPNYLVKRLVMSPDSKISLQRHQYRSEHWTVVAGSARVTIDGEITSMGQDDSIFIDRGVSHRLENIGADDLVVVEVQVGDKLDEEDVERISDEYGRD